MSLYCIEFTAFKFSIPRTPLEVNKTGHELFSSNFALQVRLCQTRSCKHDAQAARKTAAAELGKMSSHAAEMVELRKQQVASDLSV